MKKRYTKQEKQAYFKAMREQWQAAKVMAANNKEIEAIN